MSKLDENELRKHDRAVSDAVEYFFTIAIDEDLKSAVREVEGNYTELMDVVIEKYELPEDWE